MKITLQHWHLRSTDRLDSFIERQIFALQPRLQIDEANVRLERHREQSPPFRVHIHLTTPGPDVAAEGWDHTLRAAVDKVLAVIETKLDHRKQKQSPKVQANRQAPAMVRQGRGRN